MTVTIDTTQDQILTDLRAFLLGILPHDVEVVQGQNNRVVEPAGPDFVVMTPMYRMQLATNVDTWDTTNLAPTTLNIMQATQMSVQLDVHGPASEDNLQIISTLFRDYYGVDQMDNYKITPLYTEDAVQAPFINGEGQYENRWTMKVVFQINPVVVTPQDFADIVTTSIFSVGI